MCLLPAAAGADPAHVRLAWVRGRGASQCPDGRQLAALVRERAGGDVLRDGSSVSVEASVARVETPTPAWQAQVFVRDAQGAVLGERTLRAADPDCARVVEAVAVTVAVALDDEAVQRAAAAQEPGPAETPAPPATPPAVTAPAVTAPPVAPRRAERAPRWGVQVQAHGGLGIAALPALSGAVGLRAAVRPPRGPWIYLRADWLPSVGRAFAPGTVWAGLVTVSAGVCPLRWRASTLELSACGGVAGGVLTLEGSGFSDNQRAERGYLAVELGAALRWNLGSVAHLAAGADVVVPLIRDTARVDAVGDAFQPPVIALRPTIGVGVHFE